MPLMPKHAAAVTSNIISFPTRKAARANQNLTADDRVARMVEEVAARWNNPVFRRRSERIQALCEDEDRIKAAVAKHGSIIAAMRAGAI